MKVRSVFKYASPPPSNLCAATNISKSFPLCPPCALQPPLRSSFLSAGVGRAERRTTASRGRATIITRAGRSPRKRQRAEGRGGRNGERNGLRGRAERTKRSREPKYIRKFKSSIRNNGLRATTTTTTCKRRYGGRGGGGPEKRARRRRRRRWTEKERGRAFSRGLSVDPDER